MARKKTSAITWVVANDARDAGRQVAFVVRALGKFETQLHVAARSAMVQCVVHRQSTPLVNLIKGLSGKSVHVVGLRKWAEKHGNGLVVTTERDKDGNINIGVTFPEIEKSPPLSMAKAMEWASSAKEFWIESPPQSLFEEYSLSKQLAMALKRAEEMLRAKTQGTIKKNKKVIELTPDQVKSIDVKGIEKLRELTAMLGADVTGMKSPTHDSALLMQ